MKSTTSNQSREGVSRPPAQPNEAPVDAWFEQLGADTLSSTSPATRSCLPLSGKQVWSEFEFDLADEHESEWLELATLEAPARFHGSS
ncbi:hypothetical protein [Aeoliella sp.]|uniref:hypothetical protein n=1 Tax=Aeoliella sp. TaxID=2795800 RepID=UPI003CCBC646